MSAWDYDRIRITLWQWQEVQRKLPAPAMNTPTYTQPLTPDEGGPQFYGDDDDEDD